MTGDAFSDASKPVAATNGVLGLFLRLSSASGGLVRADDTGALFHVVGDASLTVEPGVVAYVPFVRSDLVFLLNATESPHLLSVVEDDAPAETISYQILPVAPARIALRHPYRPKFVVAATFEGGRAVPLTCNHDAPGEWEKFTLRPVQPPSARAVVLAAAIERFLAQAVSPADIVGWMDGLENDVLGAVAPALLRILPIETLHALVHLLRRHEDVLERLVTSWPPDRWVSETIRSLLLFDRERHIPAELVADESHDALGGRYAWSCWWGTTGTILNLQLRTTIEPRRGLAIVATARNEGIYLLEWIAHYRALGVEHFFIYTNNNDDRSDDLLSALSQAGIVTCIHNRFKPGTPVQLKAYAHCMSYMPAPLDFAWLFVVDLDEFVVLETSRYPTLRALVDARAAEGATSISLNWRVMTNSGALHWSDRPLLERNVHRVDYGALEVKTICLTRNFLGSHPHDPMPVPGVPLRYVDAAGDPHHWPGRGAPPCHGSALDGHAWIAHYYFKSIEEWIWKTARNKGDADVKQELVPKINDVVPQLHDLAKARALPDQSALVHVPALERELALLRALPGVAAAERVVQMTFRARVDELSRKLKDELGAMLSRGEDPEERISKALRLLQ